MPDPSHLSYHAMTIIRPHAKPFLWWLFPWSYARVLHRAANALRALSDRQDDTIALQASIIAEQRDDIELLKRRITDLEDAIIIGRAIVPDATPHRDETIHE